MKTPKKSFLDQLANSDPEMAEIAAEIRQDYESGLLMDVPRSHRDCSSWREAWLYSFKRANLHPSDFIMLENSKVIRVVWIGKNFSDELVGVLKKVADRLGPDRELAELRLIGTNVSDQTLQSLKMFLPKAAITQYSEEAREINPRLAYADPAMAKQMFPE